MRLLPDFPLDQVKKNLHLLLSPSPFLTVSHSGLKTGGMEERRVNSAKKATRLQGRELEVAPRNVTNL